MFESIAQSMTRKPRPRQSVSKYGPWSGGLVTEFEPEQMRNNELFEALNIILVGQGVARTRDGSTLVCSGCSGAIVQADDIKVGSTWYTIISDTDNNLYYDDAGTANLIFTMEGPARFVGFMGLLMIFDGSFIKAWDGTKVFMVYDNGLGTTRPYQFNNRYEDETTTLPLGNGTVTRVNFPFTSQSWTSGLTMPVTHVYAKMKKTGTPTGTVTAKLRLASDDSVLASSDILTKVEDFVTDSAGLEYEAIFLEDEVTTEMDPATDYIVSLEYAGGSSSDYVDVLAVDTSTPVMALKPGMPPKAVFGLVYQDRLHCIEGEDGENPSWRWYCGAGNHLDWSSPNGGGYTPVIDQSATNYPIGAMAEWNGGLWFMGTPRQPFLGKQTGESPSAYKIYATTQKVSGDYKSVVVTPDDIVFAHPAGIDMVSSVQEASDIAAKSQTDKIRKTIQKYYTNGAVAGYDPVWGLYLLKMEGTDDIIVVHTRAKAIKYSGQVSQAYSPVSMWNFQLPGNISSFGHGNGFMLVGNTEGEIYRMDNTKTHDDEEEVDYALKTSYDTTSFGEKQAYKLNINAFCRFGGRFKFKFYRNQSRTSFFELPVSLILDSTVKTSEMTDVFTLDADFYALSDSFFDRADINFNFRTLMVGIEEIKTYGKPMYFGPIQILANNIGGF